MVNVVNVGKYTIHELYGQSFYHLEIVDMGHGLP